MHLKFFRNHIDFDITFSPGINVIWGKNGVGKTSILEAVYILSIGKSFKTNKSKEIINNKSKSLSVDGFFYDNENDLRIDTYRSSGAGGQHVNTTDSAVRITHIPSKIVVQCQNERSQHKNKETCMNMLRARLYDFEMKKKDEENQNNEASKSEIGWGHQIRSYVLQPYRLVKDNRTNFESTSPDKVLDGDIDVFLEKSLYQIK